MTRLLAVDGRRTRFNQNLVGDFERNPLPSGFTWNYGTGSFTRETVADALTGTTVVRAVADGAIHDLASQVIPCTAGDLYYGEAMFRRTSDAGLTSSGSIHLGISVKYADNSMGYPAFDAFDTKGIQANNIPTTWTRLAGFWRAPSAAVQFQVRPSIRNNVTAGTFECDSVIIRKVA